MQAGRRWPALFFKNYGCLIETQLFAFCYRQTVLNWGSFNVYWNSAGKEGFIRSSCYVWIFWQLDTCCTTSKVIRIDIIPENLAWGELHLRRVNCTSPGYVASNPWKQAGGRSFHRKIFLEKLNLSTRRPGGGVIGNIISGFRLKPFIAKLQSFLKQRFY